MAEPEPEPLPEWTFLFQELRLDLSSRRIFSPLLANINEDLVNYASNVPVFCTRHNAQPRGVAWFRSFESESGYTCTLFLYPSQYFYSSCLLDGRRLMVYYRWVGGQMEVMLDQGVAPEIPFEHVTPWTSLAFKERVEENDQRTGFLVFPSISLRTFYESSPAFIKELIDWGVMFDLRVYNAGKTESFKSQILVYGNQDDLTDVDNCNLLIDTLNFWVSVSELLQINEWIRVYYRYLEGRLEVRLVTAMHPQHPDHYH